MYSRTKAQSSRSESGNTRREGGEARVAGLWAPFDETKTTFRQIGGAFLVILSCDIDRADRVDPEGSMCHPRYFGQVEFSVAAKVVGSARSDQ